MAAAAAAAAAVGTAAWAVLLSGSTYDDLRYALIAAGALGLLSCAAIPPQAPPGLETVGFGALLLGYQGAIYVAVSGGPLMQALINCNVVLIALYHHFCVARADHAAGLFIASITTVASAALLACHRF